MANEKHLLLTAIGGYTDTELATEGWQVGVRLALVFGSVDPVGTLPNNWDPSAVDINRTEANWNITGNWHTNVGLNYFEPDDYLNDQAAPAFSTWIESISGMSNHTRLDTLKIYPIGTNGKAVPAPPYATGTPVVLTWTSSNPSGSNAGNHLPLQIAAVASHRTAQIGRPGRGRMFVPGLNTGLIQPDGQFDSTWCTSMAGHQKDLLEALAFSGVGGTSAHVRPIITGGGYTKYGVINQVRVGQVPDTQRRRRRSLVETYQSVAVTY